jgi:ABC-type amino acid transport substrate-binding protein
MKLPGLMVAVKMQLTSGDGGILVHRISIGFLVFALFFMISCSEQATYTELEQLEGKVFAVPTGTVGDQLVLQRFTDVEFQYYNTVLDCALAVKNGNAMPLLTTNPY